ncbi:MAG: valine--tRNA ligase [Opitutales bacterium]
MSEIPKAYDPSTVEARTYAAWEAGGCFHAEAGDPADKAQEAFCIMIPPPNVTGVLHMGHLLNNTIQDMLTRRARQEGKRALWMPGTDHAGIATQTRIEKELRKEGRTRHDLGREGFVEAAGKWRDEHGGIILKQLRRLGASCDWRRTAHTLDPGYSRAVLTAFVKLHERGYIYRGKAMINWCPATQTALSNEEVIMKPQRGKLYRMRYEIVESPGEFLEISTTRPETIMGDTGVAVHPDDARYRHLVGKHCWRPFPREAIPIVADSYIDRQFGTGVLKVTPAHDKADWEIGQRHDLPAVDVFNPDGTLNDRAGPDFAGMERFAARKAAAQKLEELGLLVQVEDYDNAVGFSERANVPIEPRLSEQWFMRFPKVEESIRAVRAGFVQFTPKHVEKTYFNWVENLHDWCISRQLWWGHRIPVWYKKGADRADPANHHVSVDGPPDPENWEQEEDVLDTWASSWLWPFATLGWPDLDAKQRRELDFWYPTSVLVTAHDILFFWVMRMIMAGLEFMGPEKARLSDDEIRERVPFRKVYFNGLIRDAQGRKMSKSLGNSPDALELIDKYGADGLRYGLLACAPRGSDVLFSEDRVQLGRNFCNKLWNACRFRQMSGPVENNASLDAILSRLEPERFDADDHALLARLVEAQDAFARQFAQFEFHALTQTLYELFWADFCDWYVEVSKAKLADDALRANCLALQDLCLRQVLLWLHPLTPFITEELAHRLGFVEAGAFIQNLNPGDGAALKSRLEARGIQISTTAAAESAALRDLVSRGRALKAQYNLAAKRDVSFQIQSDATQQTLLDKNRDKLLRLIGAETLAPANGTKDLPAAVTALGTLYLDLASAVDTAAEIERLTREQAKLDKGIASGSAKLSNEKFLAKAPPEVVAQARESLEALQAKRDEVERLLKALGDG